MPHRLPSTHRAAALDRAIDAALSEQRIVGAVVLVAHAGRVVYRRAAGLADREGGRPLREDAIFLLASVTKIITSTAAMVLVERGRMALSDPVTRWLPDFRPRLADGSAAQIRIEHLLLHTAGLTYDFAEADDSAYHRLGISSGLDAPGVSLAENLRRIAAFPLCFAPGGGWRYSMATDVLGAVIAAVCGVDLPRAIEALVCGPMGMRDTRFGIADASRLVTHYADGDPAPVRMGACHAARFAGETVRFAPGRLHDPAAYPSGGAGMAGTAGDVLRLLATLAGGGAPLLGAATVQDMMQDRLHGRAGTYAPGWGFGYGGAVLVDPAPTGTPQAPGTFYWSGAYGHHWFIDPAHRLVVVMLTNTAFEGMEGRFPSEVRDAAYERVAA